MISEFSYVFGLRINKLMLVEIIVTVLYIRHISIYKGGAAENFKDWR